MVPAGGGKTVRLTEKALNATSPRWAPDGSVWFLAPKDGTSQLWRVGANGGAAEQKTTLALDVNNFRLSPDGKRVLISLDVFTDCADLACTTQSSTSARSRNRPVWSTTRSSCGTGTRGRTAAARTFSSPMSAPMEKSARRAGSRKASTAMCPRSRSATTPNTLFRPTARPSTSTRESRARPSRGRPTSMSFRFPPTARPRRRISRATTRHGTAIRCRRPAARRSITLAMKRPGFEADRFGIFAIDLASGAKREIDAVWDRSASPLKESADGKTLFTMTDDNGDHALFGIDVATGKATKLVDKGSVMGFDVGRKGSVVAKQGFQASDRSLFGGLARQEPEADHALQTPSASRKSASATPSSSRSRARAATPCRVMSSSRSATRRTGSIRSPSSSTAARRAR